jgi:multidrug efflux pump subunit AcrB
MRVTLKNPKLEDQALAQMRAIFDNQPELKVLISQPSLFSLRPPIRIVFKSPDLDKLMQSNTLALDLLSSIQGIKELKSTMSLGYPELQLFYDEARLKQYQLNPLDVAQQVKAYLAGEEALVLQWGADLIPVVVRLAEQSRFDLEQFTMIQNGNQYPLSTLATWKRGVGPAQIYHTDAQRSVEISASVPADQLGLISQMIAQKLNQTQWPKGVEIDLSGQDQEMNESLKQLLIALMISIFLVYVVMATQFESLIVPLLIMGTVPLAVVGVIWGLWISHTPISVVVAIALIILAGVVVNNAIVFLEKSQQNELEGLSKLEALIEAGKSRLRPILMTTLTTLLGLLPMLWDEGEGSELRYPLALTLISGLSISTLLTLYVIPALYLQFTKPSKPIESIS